VLANARRLRKIVGRLDWNGSSAAWSGYGTSNTYGEADTELKASFVRAAAESAPPGPRLGPRLQRRQVCRGRRRVAQAVVAVDGDHAVIDSLARRLAAKRATR
jgi:hypothetical protein